MRGNEKCFARNVHVVEATKDGQTEYWAAATHREDAITAVRCLVDPDWDLVVTERRLTRKKCAELKMRHNSARELEAAP
jgi:hypothetical protein